MKQQKRERAIIDLTKPLDPAFMPFTDGAYRDPPLQISPWSSIPEEGFLVCRLSLGTQSGTHIDAPSHFLADGAPLDAIRPDQLLGQYFLLDLACQPSFETIESQVRGYRQESIVFLRTPMHAATELSIKSAQHLLCLPPKLFVLAGSINVESDEPYAFHQLVARSGRYLAEDLDCEVAHQVRAGGEMMIMPLRLIGVSGSPCRVIVRV